MTVTASNTSITAAATPTPTHITGPGVWVEVSVGTEVEDVADCEGVETGRALKIVGEAVGGCELLDDVVLVTHNIGDSLVIDGTNTELLSPLPPSNSVESNVIGQSGSVALVGVVLEWDRVGVMLV